MVAIFSDFEVVTPNGNSLGYIDSPVFSTAINISLVRSERIAHPSALYFKDAVLSAGAYLEEDFPCEDLSLWLRLSHLGDFASRPNPIIKYCLRPSSTSFTRYRQAKSKSEFLVSDFLLKNGLNTIQLNSIARILHEYMQVNRGKQKSLLFLRDLLNPRIKKYIPKNVYLYVICRLLLKLINPTYTKDALSLYLQRKRREMYRKSNN